MYNYANSVRDAKYQIDIFKAFVYIYTSRLPFFQIRPGLLHTCASLDENTPENKNDSSSIVVQHLFALIRLCNTGEYDVI